MSHNQDHSPLYHLYVADEVFKHVTRELQLASPEILTIQQQFERAIQISRPDVRQQGTGDNLLHNVARVFNLACLAPSLIKSQTELEGRNYLFETPLHKAAAVGNLLFIKTFQEHDADFYAKNTFLQTPLLMAAKHGQLETVTFFATHAPHTITQADLFTYTPLDHALHHGHQDVANFLKNQGARATKPQLC